MIIRIKIFFSVAVDGVQREDSVGRKQTKMLKSGFKHDGSMISSREKKANKEFSGCIELYED